MYSTVTHPERICNVDKSGNINIGPGRAFDEIGHSALIYCGILNKNRPQTSSRDLSVAHDGNPLASASPHR